MRRTIAWVAGIFGCVALCAAASVALFLYWFTSGWPEQECATESRTLSQNSLGQKVEYNRAVCGGIAFSDVVEVKIVSKLPETSQTILSYEPGDPIPTVTWNGDHHLTIRVDHVGSIIRQVRSARVIWINYEIGRASWLR